MIVARYYRTDSEDETHVSVLAVVNDELDLYFDPDVILEAIVNDDEFEPESEVLYTIYLQRAHIASDPLPEPSFGVVHYTRMNPDSNSELGWSEPILQF